MTTLMEERIKKYSRDDIQRIIREEGCTPDEVTYLTALSNFAIVAEIPGFPEPKLAGMMSVDILVFQVSNYPTGIYQAAGQQPIILLNEDWSLLDYDFISDLHTQHDWDVYLWLSEPWTETERSFGIHGEWYRRDVYPDGMKAFDGKTLGWEDKAPISKE